MRKIEIADITLRNAVDFSLNFKEKVEIAKQLDKLGADVVETAPITDGKTDIVLLHTISGIVKEHVISCPVGLDEKALEKLIDENVLALNTELAAYSKIGYTEIRRDAFEKSPKQSIRRFMYS